MTASEADRCLETPDGHAATELYARRFQGPAGRYLLGVQTRVLRGLIAPWPGATVLDVGGGHGQVAAPLSESGHPVTVMSSNEASWGRVRLIKHPNVRLTCGDLCRPPFDDQSFDIVVAMRAMAHVSDWRSLIAGLCRVARKAVIVDFPIPGGSNALVPLFFGTKRRFEGDTRAFAVISKREVSAAVAEEGFTVDQMTGQFVLPMAVHRALKTPALSTSAEAMLRAFRLDRVIGTPVIMRAVRNGHRADAQ